MIVEIITPEKQLYSGEADLVQLPGSKSSFEVLKNHAHIISTLRKGIIRIIEPGGNEKKFPVTGGVIENRDNHIIILVNS